MKRYTGLRHPLA